MKTARLLMEINVNSFLGHNWVLLPLQPSKSKTMFF